ncbi:hypothetical protein J6590_023672 [Homalodisca vitripennis]|nr:hypothetical protein J6590_023672 [Homalodisca vitripennis]
MKYSNLKLAAAISAGVSTYLNIAARNWSPPGSRYSRAFSFNKSFKFLESITPMRSSRRQSGALTFWYRTGPGVAITPVSVAPGAGGPPDTGVAPSPSGTELVQESPLLQCVWLLELGRRLDFCVHLFGSDKGDDKSTVRNDKTIPVLSPTNLLNSWNKLHPCGPPDARVAPSPSSTELVLESPLLQCVWRLELGWRLDFCVHLLGSDKGEVRGQDVMMNIPLPFSLIKCFKFLESITSKRSSRCQSIAITFWYRTDPGVAITPVCFQELS